MRSSQRGNHQLRSPSSSIVAGTSTIRTMVASISTADDRPSPTSFSTRTLPRMKLPKTHTMIAAAAVMTRAVEAKPSFQHDSGCAKRTVADVSAVADPNTGVAVYDTYNSCGTSSICDFLISLGLVQGADGWVQVGGTSASSPIIASVYALAGTGLSNATPYAHTSALYDVTSGSNGSCGGSYLCTAKAGYDGPTGLGTPNGTGAF